MYKPCCEKPRLVSYRLEHDPAPLELPEDLTEAIERLLWYIPNIPSYQSHPHELIANPLYNEFCFRYLMFRIGMGEEDVLWVDEIPEKLMTPFIGNICVNCQKLILRRSRRTKTADLLRHIRNCIAHGHFNLCGNMLIGFDYDQSRKRYTAAIKLRPKTLLHALQLLDSEITKEALFSYAFRKLGYTVERRSKEEWGDMLVEREGNRYCVEIKVFPEQTPYIGDDFFRRLLRDFNSGELPPDVEPILVVDTARLTKKAKRLLPSAPVRVMDMGQIEKLMRGVDVLT